MDPKDRLARRDRLRARAVTTTVVATVVAAPVLALWAAYRGAPSTAEHGTGNSTRVSASGSETPAAEADGRPFAAYENAGNAARTGGRPAFPPPGHVTDVSVEVISTGAPQPPGASPTAGPGRLTAHAVTRGGTTLLTLSASGGAPVDWYLWSDASWLHASRTSGTLAPGESVTLKITVDRDAQPPGPWSARVGVEPSGAVIAVRGQGRPAEPAPDPTPTPPTPTPTPTPPVTSPPSPDPTPPATSPPPEPTPTPTPPQPTPSPSDSTGGTVSPAPSASAT
ncbi:BACON domain-containing protein [Streptomyces bambusae]|uniref:BACON domain-containing protein n=1 Tax=Streptomyces bambusae TaxID=1550616 RepID=UPI001CA4EED8|nr:hypothetical protein [Streptomyces bambusae]